MLASRRSRLVPRRPTMGKRRSGAPEQDGDMDARRMNDRWRIASREAEPPAGTTDGATIADDEVVRRRRGLTALTRGILLARRRRFEAARAAFADALRAEAALELTDDPAFWDLERSAHLA